MVLIPRNVRVSRGGTDQYILRGGTSDYMLRGLPPSGTLAGYTTVAEYTGDGAEDTFLIPFPYMDPSQLVVEVFGSGAWTRKYYPEDFDLVSTDLGTAIQFTTADVPATDETVRLWRRTPRGPAERTGRMYVVRGITFRRSPGDFAQQMAEEIEDQIPRVEIAMAGVNLNVGQTSVSFTPDGADIQFAKPGGPHAITFDHVWVSILHFDAAPPSDWVFGLYVQKGNGATATQVAKLPVTLGASGVDHHTRGRLQEVASSTEIDVDLEAGWTFRATLTGSALDNIVARAGLSWRRRIPG